MIFLDHLPLVGIFLWFITLILIIVSRDGLLKNKLTKSLIVFICLCIIDNIGAYFLFNEIKNNLLYIFFGVSVGFWHLKGAIIFLILHSIFSNTHIIKKWGAIVIVLTLIRFLALIYAYQITSWEFEDYLDFGASIFWIDYYLADLCNIVFLLASILYVKTLVFAIGLTPDKRKKYNSLKQLLTICVCFGVCTIAFSMISNINNWDTLNLFKINVTILNFLFIVIIIFIARPPIFHLFSNFNELESGEFEKYTHSTLNQEECYVMMIKIISIIEKERAYFDPEYRLNNLANSCNLSVHKVSQVINQIEGISFSDFINRYRVEEAKKMLISEKYKTHTILAIAHEVGFNSKTAFYNAFNKVCEVSPSAYVKQNIVH
ncbi:MAG: helix-turn-helix domain-containing protein [Flavobacteriales bacterium]|nr:helix-turn-helix domain-containing protein [Flavobacteriales bacterium]